jgi:hypothetical protein
MARTVTISELTTRSLRRAKMVNSQFPDTGEVDRLVREAVAELYDKLIAARGAHYYMQRAEGETLPGIPLMYLPSDFYKLCSVYVNQSASAGIQQPNPQPGILFPVPLGAVPEYTVNGWQLIGPFMDQEQPGLMNATSATPYATMYRLRGQQEDANYQARLDLLELCPVPRQPFVVQVQYIPVASTEPIPGPAPTDPVVNGWEDYVAIRVAMTLLDEEESNTTHLERDLARMEARIEALAASRDEGRAERLQDTAGILDAQQLWGVPVRPRWW